MVYNYFIIIIMEHYNSTTGEKQTGKNEYF